MTQRIAIKLQMNGEKERIKAMKIASELNGVVSVTVNGINRDQLVVIGNGVDSVTLTRTLRKKIGHATIESVQRMNDTSQNEQEDTRPYYSTSYNDLYPQTYYNDQYPHTYYNDQYPSRPVYYNVVYDPYPNSCIIM